MLRRAIALGGCSLLALAATAAGAQTVTAIETAQTAPGTVPTAQSGAAIDPDAAADQADTGLEEIIVTAERRATNLQRTALAVSAVTGDSLSERQITSVESLAQSLPNVSFGALNGDARIAIRGVGFDNINIGNEPRIAFHVDGVYVSRPSGALAIFFDVERVEVVRGPQGTLYGRNATGGAVNVITRDPTNEYGGFVSMTAGNYETISAEAGVNIPINDSVAVRVAGISSNHSGYSNNLTTGTDVDDQHLKSVRGKLRFDLGADARIVLAADYVTQADRSGARHFFGAGSRTVPPATAPFVRLAGLRFGGGYSPNDRDVATDIDPRYRRENYSFTGTLTADLGVADLTSVTGYRNTDFRLNYDLDGSNVPLTDAVITEQSRTISQEIRLSRTFAWGDILIGGYYFNEELSGATSSPLDRRLFSPPGTPRSVAQGLFVGGSLETDAYALFGQARLQIAEPLALVVGGRYSSETKSVNEVAQIDIARTFDPANPVIPRPVAGTQIASDSDSAFTPRVTLEYRPAPNLFAYATYARGFKAGGYNLGGIQPAFQPEELTDYEVGIKADLFDNTLRTNLSAFYYSYTNLQVSKVTGAVISIENAADARVKGLELEVIALPFEGLQLEASGALLDAKYQDFFSIDPANPTLGAPPPGSPPGTPPQQDLSGKRLSQAPEYTISLAAQYRFDLGAGGLTIRGEHNRSDKFFFSQFNVDPVSQPAYGVSNAFLTYEPDATDLRLTAFVRNIEDVDVRSSATVTSVGFAGAAVVGNLQPPRTYGVQIALEY